MVLMLIKCYCLLQIHGHLCDRGSLSFFVGEGVDLAKVIKELKYV